MNEAVFVFTPSYRQHIHLENVLDSIAKNISIPYKFCLFTDKLNEDFDSKYDVLIKLVEANDLADMEALYFKEGRADIPAFSAYAQFVLPRYFPEFENFIYMEVDQYVCKDVAPLWKECIDKKMILGASAFLDDDFVETTTTSFDKIHPGKKCFNTGVLFVNTKYWLENSFEKLCFAEAELQKKSNGKRLQFYAQGAIVNSLHNYITEFSWKYNTPCFGSVRGISPEIIDSAVVMHWTGPLKPWCESGLYKDIYFSDVSLKNPDDYYIRYAILNKMKIKFKRFVRFVLRKILK